MFTPSRPTPQHPVPQHPGPPSRDLSAPSPPEEPARPGFPLLATLAPVVASLALFAITRSPFALVFAILGPVVAVGGLLDGRRQARRRRREERHRFEREVEAAIATIDREHARLRDHLRRTSRTVPVLTDALLHDPERWRCSDGVVSVVLGVGEGRGGVRLTGGTGVPHEHLDDAGTRLRRGRGSRARQRRATESRRVAEELTTLRSRAAVAPDLPVRVDARLGLGVCGPTVPAVAAARGLVLQLADALPPGIYSCRGGFEGWQARLPHAAPPAEGDPHDRVVFAPVSDTRLPEFTVVVARHEQALPRECRVAVEVEGAQLRVVRHPSRGLVDDEGVPLVPDRLRAEFATRAQAEAVARVLGTAALREGLVAGPRRQVPDRVGLSQVWDEERNDGPPGEGLPAVFLSAGDPMPVDLVADGPHAIVGGTTGSGKSELLISWIVALARHHGPHEVTFLLVDFKGGASFAPVADLPHSVGLVTDLDAATAGRALESLRAELRHRERVIAEAGVRSIDELPGIGSAASVTLPRLVVVVDEFAALAADFPELSALFSDVAARGRSLGLHLVLCTQRPAGVIRDAVLANCTLRLSLRVSNPHDSSAVIGTDAAASLPRDPIGRCLVSVAGEPPVLTQVAVTTEGEVEEVAGRWAGAPPARPPWLPPLPPLVTAEDAAPHIRATSGEVVFGLCDLPEHQTRDAAVWRPSQHGGLLVVGGQGVGRTGTLRAVASGARRGSIHPVVLPGRPEEAWDTLMGLRDSVVAATVQRPTIVLVDDLDALLTRFPDTHTPAVTDALTLLLREGSGVGVWVAASARRITPQIQGLASLFDSRLLLRMPSRQEHVLAGGEGQHHDPAAPPGRGRWGGSIVQVLHEPADPTWTGGAGRVVTRTPVDLAPAGPLAIVTTRPTRVLAMLRDLVDPSRLCAPHDVTARLAAGEPVLAVADPATWQGAWAALAAVRAAAPLMFDGCSVAEFRLISGRTDLPPPLGPAPGGVWLLPLGGELCRGGIPS